jgi:hypothetical protein
MRMIPHFGKVILLFLLLFSRATVAQTTKEERKAFWQTPFDKKIAAIQSGQLLEFAAEMPIEKFMVNMLWYKPQRMSKKEGNYTEEILFQDTAYTYFGKKTVSYLFDFYKVKNHFLTGIDYLHLNREEIENRFKEEIIPVADKKKVTEKLPNYKSINDISRFEYTYVPAEKIMQVIYRWKIDCNTCLSRAVNKVYRAKFSLVTRQFIQ